RRVTLMIGKGERTELGSVVCREAGSIAARVASPLQRCASGAWPVIGAAMQSKAPARALALAAALLLGSAHAAERPSVVAEGKPVPLVPDASGWYSLFDGKTLSGWLTFDPGGWTIEDGTLVGRGERSHLFRPNTYRNLEFRAEIRLNHRGNSGMYFRAKLEPGWPTGYEAQVENTSPDRQRTGSLYNFASIS